MIIQQVAQVFFLYWITLGGYLYWLLSSRSKIDKKLDENNL